MASLRLVASLLLALFAASSASRGLRAREISSRDHGSESFAQTGRRLKKARDDDDDEHDRAEDDTEDDDEVQEVVKDVPRGQFRDGTTLLVEGSNALLASARAAVGDAPSFAQTGRMLRTASGEQQAAHKAADDDDDEHDRADGTDDEDEVQEVVKDAPRGPVQDGTTLMVEGSKALLASARAAAGDAPSFAQTGSRARKARDDDDDEHDRAEGEESDDDEVQEVVHKDRPNGQLLDGTSLMVQGSNALLASARAAVGEAPSFAQLGSKARDDDDDEHDRAEDDTEDDDEVQEVRKDAPRGQFLDGTTLLVQGSNALLASAKAAAGDA